ncbi:L-type lectin-domain containing receptor kinase IV.2-like protein [Carex littledalei]|uniref:non-specific serine/threonine protein kinase n=1 Tax=Carex littledalei TaxID=544730 RepID=A0A833RH75_9POAL|nr:L-type lectin-domain containing receptor kinase IV.2-like protein [Carex littledalei]
MVLGIFLLLMDIFFLPLHATDSEFIFNGFTGSNLSLTGLAQITSNGLLLLTNNTIEEKGHAFSPSRIKFKNSSGSGSVALSFSTTFVFGIVPQYPDVGGHGLAFAISPYKDLPGSMPSQHLGLLNDSSNGKAGNHLIAIELDTVKTIEYYDIDNNHVGIDINGLTSLNSSTAGYYESTADAFTKLNLMAGDATQVWINYDAASIRLDVRIAPFKMPKPGAPLVSSIVNLSDIALDEMYVGFSASTGAGSSHHYVSGWSFSTGGEAEDLDQSRIPSIPKKANTKKGRLVSVAVLVALALAGFSVLLILVLSILFFCHQRRKKFEEVKEDWESEYGPHRIPYVDIYRATKGFDETNLVGSGGFGKVYKGVMPKSRAEVAVKRISHDSRQGIREFVSEIASMSRLRHRNLVQLLGYCRRQGELFLVYEFMANGSLDRILFEEKEPSLNWGQRLKIIKDVAAGLLYLHEGWEQLVIHRDIKASNVLLDEGMNAKISDFGLARLYDHGSNPKTTHIIGTLGYLAPELSKTGKATTCSDVFGFGAFLLEVVCGRRPMEFCAGQDDVPGLVELVSEWWKKGKIFETVDLNMKGSFDKDEAELVLKLGLICSHPEPTARPSMRQVIQFLEGSIQIPDKSMESLGGSFRFASYDVSFDDFATSYPSTAEITSTSDHHRSSAFTDSC